MQTYPFHCRVDAGHSGGGDFSQRWTNITPFSEDHLFDMQSLSVSQVQQLLDQYVEQERMETGFWPDLDTAALAKIIHERTNGFPGLTGLCCSEILGRLIATVEDWNQWCGADLACRVQLQQNCSIIQNMVQLLASSKAWPRLREVMQDLSLHGVAVARCCERRTIVEKLLSDGLAEMVTRDVDKDIQARSPDL